MSRALVALGTLVACSGGITCGAGAAGPGFGLFVLGILIAAVGRLEQSS